MADTTIETMRDRGKFWSPAPDWADARIETPGWSARVVAGLGQTLISGDLDAAVAALAPGAVEVGLWGTADTDRLMVRIARDRALLVTPLPLDIEPRWYSGGFVVTPCDDAYTVIEISGEALPEIIAEGTSADLEGGSRSASILFAGVAVFLYRTGEATARLHVESPLAAYLWTWLKGREPS